MPRLVSREIPTSESIIRKLEVGSHPACEAALTAETNEAVHGSEGAQRQSRQEVPNPGRGGEGISGAGVP